MRESRSVVVVGDVDLEKFFDRVNYDMLMGRLAKRIADRRALLLIRRCLNAGVLANGGAIERQEGTPQGGPLSPLLANVLLDEVDKELERRGDAFVRYADDLKGETPVVEGTGAHHRMSLISTMTSRRHMRFMIKERGGVNAAVFIEFLKRLITDAKCAVFLIVDRGSAHIARKTRAFVEGLNGRLRLSYLPPYSPDRNPDELV